MHVWILDELDDGRIELTAPNGTVVFRVSKETADMLGHMLIDVANSNDDRDEGE